MENGIKFDRLYKIIEQYPRGVAAEFVEKVYKTHFGESLEDEWLSTLPKNAFSIDDINPCLTVLYIRPITSKQIQFKSDNSLVDEHTITINESSIEDQQQPWQVRLNTSRMSSTQLCAQLITVEMVENRHSEVVVTHFCIKDGELNIFVRLYKNEQKYEKMLEEMSDNYGDGTETGGADKRINTPLDIRSIADAGLYVVHYNNQWHRAILMFIEGVSVAESIELYLLDIGQYIMAPLSHIRNATVDLIDYPIFAIRCQLADLDASSDFGPIVRQLEDRDDEDCFSVELVSKEKPISRGCLVNRIRLFDIFGQNLGEKCSKAEENGNSAQTMETTQNEDYLPPTSQSFSDTLTEQNINGAQTESTNCAQEMETSQNVSSADPLQTSTPHSLEQIKNSAQPMETSQNVTKSLMDWDNGIDVTRPLLPTEIPSAEFRAFVVFAPDPSDFTIHLECAQAIPELIKQITETDEFICQSPIENEPIPGHYYLAKVNHLWQRVYASENSRFQKSHKYRVFLVDSGHFEVVEIENIKEMILPLFEPKMMAIKCELFGVKPTPPSHYWSAEAETCFSSRVTKEASEGIIVHVKGDWYSWNSKYACGLPKVKADIFDAKTKQNIGDWLINNGYAIANFDL